MDKNPMPEQCPNVRNNRLYRGNGNRRGTEMS